jgi:hypothetical protein
MDLFDLSSTVNEKDLGVLLIPGQQRFGLRIKDAQSVKYRLLIIICTVLEQTAAEIAAHIGVRWLGVDIEHGAATGAGSAARQALDQALFVQFKIDDSIKREVDTLQKPMECLSLRNIAWEAIKNKTTILLRMDKMLFDDSQHQFITHQLASLHCRLCLKSLWRFLLYSVTKQIASSDLWRMIAARQQSGLCPLT